MMNLFTALIVCVGLLALQAVAASTAADPSHEINKVVRDTLQMYRQSSNVDTVILHDARRHVPRTFVARSIHTEFSQHMRDFLDAYNARNVPDAVAAARKAMDTYNTFAFLPVSPREFHSNRRRLARVLYVCVNALQITRHNNVILTG